MYTEASRHSENLHSYRHQQSKFSLRTRSRITQNTESSTTCMSVYPHGKISLKNISSRNVHSTKSASKCYSLNIKYQDIVAKKPTKSKILFRDFFCSQTSKVNNIGCDCDIKCPWMDKWMARVTPMMHAQKIPYQEFESVKPNILNQIEKDLRRTQPESLTFQNEAFLDRLKETLISYHLCDPQVSYMQGMNIVASIPVYHSKSSYQAIKTFEMIMKKCNLREIYINDLKNAKSHCQQIILLLKNKSSQLYNFLVEIHEIDLQMFIIGWLFSLLGSFVPLEHMHLVLDAFIERGWSAIYSIIFTLLLYLRPKILNADEQTEIMGMLSIQNLCESEIDWQEIILSSANVPISPKQVYRK